MIFECLVEGLQLMIPVLPFGLMTRKMKAVEGEGYCNGQKDMELIKER